MKTINETFTDQEFRKLSKKKGYQNWHDFILSLISESCKPPDSNKITPKSLSPEGGTGDTNQKEVNNHEGV